MPSVVDVDELARRAKVHPNFVREMTALGILQVRPVPGFPLYDVGNLYALAVARKAVAKERRGKRLLDLRRLSKEPIKEQYRNDPRGLILKMGNQLSLKSQGHKVFSDLRFALVTPAYVQAMCAYAGISPKTLFKAIGLKYESGIQMLKTYHPLSRSVSAIRARAAIYWLSRFLIANKILPSFFVFLCGIHDKGLIKKEIRNIKLYHGF